MSGSSATDAASVDVDALARRAAAKYAEAAAMEPGMLRELVSALVDDARRLEVFAADDIESMVELRFRLDPAATPGDVLFLAAAVLANVDVAAKARLGMLERDVLRGRFLGRRVPE